MLKKLNRLSTKFEYNVTRKHGSHYKGDFVHIFMLEPNNYEGPAKIGIVTSKKLHKSAVKRNRIKRVYRQAVMDNLPNIKKNLWLVIQPNAKSLDKKYEEISTDFNKILQEASVFN